MTELSLISVFLALDPFFGAACDFCRLHQLLTTRADRIKKMNASAARVRVFRLSLQQTVPVLLLAWVALTGGAASVGSKAFPAGSAGGGVDYYVNCGSGSDSNSGTSPAAAWKTLDKVNATTFHPGDRILFKSGCSWTGQLWPKGSGSAEHPILVDHYGGDVLPAINGAGLAQDAVLLKNQEYWEIRNLAITNTGSTPGVRCGVNLIAENSGDLHHLYLEGLHIRDVNGSEEEKANGGISYHAIGDAKPSRPRLALHGRSRSRNRHIDSRSLNRSRRRSPLAPHPAAPPPRELQIAPRRKGAASRSAAPSSSGRANRRKHD